MVRKGIRNHSRFVAINPANSEKNTPDEPLERRPTGEQFLSSREAGTDRNRCGHNQRGYHCLLEPRCLSGPVELCKQRAYRGFVFSHLNRTIHRRGRARQVPPLARRSRRFMARMFCRPDRHARRVRLRRCLRLTAGGRSEDLARLRIQFNYCVVHFQPFKFKSWKSVFTEVLLPG